MRNWVRKLLLLVALLLALAAALSGVGVALFKGTPDWYGSDAASAADRARLARDAENKLIEAQNWAATLRADEERAARLRAKAGASATLPAARAEATHLVEFSQQEVNALLDKWSTLHNWRSKYGEFLEDPQVVLRDGNLILAARVRDLGAIVSFQFRPQLTEEGDLKLDLLKVTGGRLRLPEAVWSAWRNRLVASLQRRMPEWSRRAQISPTGSANVPAMTATLSRLLIDVAARKPADPVLFFPLADGGASVPVKVADVNIEDHTLKLRVRPLTPDERAALLARIRSGDPLSTAPPPRETQAAGE
ncbi:MAG: hypothetical protein ABIP55_08410 [Tepidisphaeraceae bacterium]